MWVFIRYNNIENDVDIKYEILSCSDITPGVDNVVYS